VSTSIDVSTQYLLSYAHFAKLKPVTLIPVCLDLKIRYDYDSDIAYIDSTNMQVCRHTRIKRNQVFVRVTAV
jgi:hypothetical protein